MDAEQQGDGSHDDQGQHAFFHRVGIHELTAKVNHRDQTQQVEPMACGEQQGAAADATGQLAKRGHRTREGHSANEDADVDFTCVDGVRCAFQIFRGLGVYKGGITHQCRRHADHAVHERH